MLCTQLALAQSEFSTHACPALHGLHEPPQSLSVSVPLRTPSLQSCEHTPDVHTRSAQSLPAPQCFPVAHLSQLPPQSTSLSPPSRTLFAQLELA